MRKKDKSGRPSPSESATLFGVGTQKRGGDGNMWEIKRASNGAEREFRGRAAKTTPLDAALIFDAKAGTFELRRVAAAAASGADATRDIEDWNAAVRAAHDERARAGALCVRR